MDKYVKMLFIKLSQKYKVTITTIMFYNDEHKSIGNIIKLKIANKADGKTIKIADFSNKRDLVSEMMLWQS